MESNLSPPLNVFYCYAREDHALRDDLDKHLADLRRSGLIKAWYDGEIIPGASWEKEIETHLKTAQVILLLVSADFIHSDYCYSNEMVEAIKRHDANEARVVPVLLRATDCSNAPFNRLQKLPSDAMPVTSWENRDEALIPMCVLMDKFEWQETHANAEQCYLLERTLVLQMWRKAYAE